MSNSIKNDIPSTDFKVLSLSGGGFRGLYTAIVLRDIERYVQQKYGYKSISECFDLITGTSIGGIIALAIAHEIPMEKVVDLFESHGNLIFKKRIFNFGIFQSKYSNETLKDILKNWFGNAIIGDLKHRVVIPSIDYTCGRPVTFKTPHHENFIRACL